MRRAIRASAVSLASLVLFAGAAAPRVAHATGAIEFPDNGSEQEGRGGAWVARASDPLAAFYNPAGLAGQATRLTLQANLSTQNTCFTRVKAYNDTTQDGYQPGATYPQVCQNGGFFPNPQIAFNYRVNERIGIGLALLGPSAVGGVAWPDFQGTSASPQRNLLVDSTAILIEPTIGIGWEVVDNLRLGASFIFGSAPNLDLINASPALLEGMITPQANEIRSELKARDLFIPGFTLGVLYSFTPELDLAAWYKYLGDIHATGDVVTEANFYYNPANPAYPPVYGSTAKSNCNNPALLNNPCGSGNNAQVTVKNPMEAKLGLRYHKRRGAAGEADHKRDPMSQDVFDVEADLTWANDSAFDAIQIRFPGTAGGQGTLPANPYLTGATLPPNADVPHKFQDVFGVRVGGDYNVLPDQLAVRAGAFFETQAAQQQYQNIDFDAAARFGVALGGTYRLHLGEHPLDLMAGYGHVFFGTLSNTDPKAAGLHGLTGEPCQGGASQVNGVCPGGNQAYRTPWAINLGTITSSIDVINVGAAIGF